MSADLKAPESLENSVIIPLEEIEKQTKQSLFGAQIDVNLNKNGNLIPVPSFISMNSSYGNGIGAGGSLIIPLQFPLSFFPPLNLSMNVAWDKNVSFAVNAGASK